MPTNAMLNGITYAYRGLRRRTKTAYLRVFDQPNYLFGRGTRTTIFPNGQREIWISNPDGTASFRIRASDGPAGFSLTVLCPVGTLPADVHAMKRSDYRTTILEDIRETTITAYYPDPYSQAFREWYASDATLDDHNRIHPADQGLTPREMKPEAVDR